MVGENVGFVFAISWVHQKVKSAIGILHLSEKIRLPFRFLKNVAFSVIALRNAEIVEVADTGEKVSSKDEVMNEGGAVDGVLAVVARIMMTAAHINFRGPVAILLAAPLGLTGALIALALTGVPFNVSSFMGLILLIGLIVKNGIILLDAAHHFHDKGESPREALLHAGELRLRPILMTTLCTLAGLFPLALGLGSGAELQRPLAIAVLGGLTLSTFVTLLLLPVGLEAFGALRKPEDVGLPDGQTDRPTARPPAHV